MNVGEAGIVRVTGTERGLRIQTVTKKVYLVVTAGKGKYYHNGEQLTERQLLKRIKQNEL